MATRGEGTRSGRCTNFGLCSKADTKELQRIPDGADFVCEECKRPLTAVGEAQRKAGLDPVPWVIGLVLLLILGGIGFYFFGRRREAPPVTSSAGSPQAPPAAANVTPLLRLSGSNTIGAELAPALAEAWLASRGGTGLHRESLGQDESRVVGASNGQPVAVDVKAHGSKTAFTDLGSGAADIGMASRRITSNEAADAKGRGLGDLTTNANERVLGLDGVAVIVNETNDADSMTKEQLAQIFSGTASGQEWHVYARDDKSGTYDTFKSQVLGDRSLVSSAKRFEDSRALASAVASDPKGIGFVGLPYATGVKKVAVAEKGATALVPTTMTVRTESYPLTRRLYFYLTDNAKPEAREFVRWVLSPAGQDVVEKAGFVGQKVEVISGNQAPANAPKDYLSLAPSADRLSVDFRFRTGSSALDTKAVDDINRVASALNSQFNGRGIMLVGFADNTGTAAGNVVLSKNRAQAVAAQMQRQGITPASTLGFGQELPVADNSTPDGREKNRRVEVWLRH